MENVFSVINLSFHSTFIAWTSEIFVKKESMLVLSNQSVVEDGSWGSCAARHRFAYAFWPATIIDIIRLCRSLVVALQLLPFIVAMEHRHQSVKTFLATLDSESIDCCYRIFSCWRSRPLSISVYFGMWRPFCFTGTIQVLYTFWCFITIVNNRTK